MIQHFTHQVELAGPLGPARSAASGTDSAAQVNAQIDALVRTDLPELQKRWRDIHGSVAPARLGSEFLMRAIAFHLQERLLGGLSRQAKLRFKALESRVSGETGATKGAPASLTLRAGTKFVREWQGETHEVQAVENGQFVYRGKMHRSLSVVAREITGTHQSGPRFFGIDRQSAKQSAKVTSHG